MLGEEASQVGCTGRVHTTVVDGRARPHRRNEANPSIHAQATQADGSGDSETQHDRVCSSADSPSAVVATGLERTDLLECGRGGKALPIGVMG